MYNTADFLVEFFSEEIPARMQLKGAEDFKNLFLAQFKQAGLMYKTADVYVTPRRLALNVTGLSVAQGDQTIERRGPKVGAPDQAVQGFLNSVGLNNINQLEQRETPKGTFYFANEYVKGSQTIELLPDMVNKVFRELVWPKAMRWGSNTATWVRPLRNVLCLFGGHVVHGEINLGYDKLIFNGRTQGHRFMAPDIIQVSDFQQYQNALEKAYVLLDQNKRRAKILQEMRTQAATHGYQVADDPELLDEVTGLVEWPVIVMSTIDDRYMALPQEVLVTSLKVNQKYFTLHTKDGKSLAPYYFIVSNIEATDSGEEIVKGNGRVLNARLSDAEFFYTQDQKKKLEDFLKPLSGAVFHIDLGSMSARVERLKALANSIAQLLGENTQKSVRAAELSKADLMTEMVGEFANLQGTMGYYYATLQSEDKDVAEAIIDHYKPKGPNDTLPRHITGQIVALADKLDTLVGFFAIDIKPTGSKDPFALRRCALGIIRILETLPQLNLEELIRMSYALHQKTINREKVRTLEDVIHEVAVFLTERAKVHWRDQGLRHDCIEAVLKNQPLHSIALQLKQIRALNELMQQQDGQDLVLVYKRASNIVRIEEEKDNKCYKDAVNQSYLTDPYEHALFDQLTQSLGPIKNHLAAHDYRKAMSEVATLRPHIDQFFEHVTVNAAQPQVRQNRLQLLALIRSTLENVAQFDKIEG